MVEQESKQYAGCWVLLFTGLCIALLFLGIFWGLMNEPVGSVDKMPDRINHPSSTP